MSVPKDKTLIKNIYALGFSVSFEVKAEPRLTLKKTGKI